MRHWRRPPGVSQSMRANAGRARRGGRKLNSAFADTAKRAARGAPGGATAAAPCGAKVISRSPRHSKRSRRRAVVADRAEDVYPPKISPRPATIARSSQEAALRLRLRGGQSAKKICSVFAAKSALTSAFARRRRYGAIVSRSATAALYRGRLGTPRRCGRSPRGSSQRTRARRRRASRAGRGRRSRRATTALLNCSV
jgi:hypothetical protein